MAELLRECAGWLCIAIAIAILGVLKLPKFQLRLRRRPGALLTLIGLLPVGDRKKTALLSQLEWALQRLQSAALASLFVLLMLAGLAIWLYPTFAGA